MTNEHYFNGVSDCLIAIFSSPDALKYPSTFSRLLPYVLQLESILDQCSPTTTDNRAENLTKLITQFGENLAQLIVQMSIASESQSQTYAHQFCRLVMKCTEMKGQYPIDETCSELTFNFWHALKDEVTSINDETKQTVVQQLFRPYFEHLIEVLIVKGQLPENEQLFSSEDKETFRTYRSNILDTMMCMYDVFGTRAMEILANRLVISIEQTQSWQIQESIIRLFGTGSEYIQTDENQILPKIFSLIPKLNFSHNSMINSTLIVLGRDFSSI